MEEIDWDRVGISFELDGLRERVEKMGFKVSFEGGVYTFFYKRATYEALGYEAANAFVDGLEFGH